MNQKIIRNKVPSIAEQNNNRKGMTLFNFKDTDKYLLEIFLKEKLVEEAKEILATKNDADLKYEICDLLQALDEYMILKDISDEEIKIIMQAKVHTHGKFVSIDSDGCLTAYVLDLKEDING